jgi:hypothetical protein
MPHITNASSAAIELRKAMLRAAFFVAGVTALSAEHFEHHFESESPLR